MRSFKDFTTHDESGLINISLQVCSLCSRILDIGMDYVYQSVVYLWKVYRFPVDAFAGF